MRLSTKLTIATSLVAGILQLSAGSAAADQFGFAVDVTGTLSAVDFGAKLLERSRRGAGLFDG
jgi:hypothetical protein